MGIVLDYDNGGNIYCMGCGEDEPLDPYEYGGRILMLCEDCIKAVDDD